MSESAAEKSAINGIRTAFGVGGVLAIIAGIVILVWPAESAKFLTIILGIYAVVGGLIYGGAGIFSRSKGGWARVGHIALGLLFIAVGIFIFIEAAVAAAWLGVFIGLLIGVLWIVEGVVSLSTLGDAASKGWTIFFAIISIIAGLFLVFTPLYGAFVLWWLLGIMLVVLGIVQIVRAFKFSGRDL